MGGPGFELTTHPFHWIDPILAFGYANAQTVRGVPSHVHFPNIETKENVVGETFCLKFRQNFQIFCIIPGASSQGPFTVMTGI